MCFQPTSAAVNRSRSASRRACASDSTFPFPAFFRLAPAGASRSSASVSSVRSSGAARGGRMAGRWQRWQRGSSPTLPAWADSSKPNRTLEGASLSLSARAPRREDTDAKDGYSTAGSANSQRTQRRSPPRRCFEPAVRQTIRP